MTSRSEEIAAAASGPLWFQMYAYRGLDIPAQLVRRAEAAGYRAVVVTIDAPQLGKRERDIRNNFKLPAHVRPANVVFDEDESYIPAPTVLTDAIPNVVVRRFGAHEIAPQGQEVENTSTS